jgi:hypothetical protein
MKLFCRISGKNKFTENDIESMQETAALKAADRNPYSWNMEFLPYEDGSGYNSAALPWRKRTTGSEQNRWFVFNCIFWI